MIQQVNYPIPDGMEEFQIRIIWDQSRCNNFVSKGLWMSIQQICSLAGGMIQDSQFI